MTKDVRMRQEKKNTEIINNKAIDCILKFACYLSHYKKKSWIIRLPVVVSFNVSFT